VRWYDVGKVAPFSPGKANFDLGFGFADSKLDPEIGEWKINHVSLNRTTDDKA